MLTEIGRDQLGERDGADACLGLGRAEVVSLAVVVELAGNPDGERVEVDVRWGERGELGPAQAGESGEQDQRPVTQADRVGQGVDLLNAQHGAYRRLLTVSTLDPARVALDHVDVDGGTEDGAQEPVGLGGGDRADAGIDQLLSPLPDRSALSPTWACPRPGHSSPSTGRTTPTTGR